MKIVGYADRFSVAPGETLDFMISAEEPVYRARVTRLIHGDTNPGGPGFKSEPVASDIEGEHAGQHQVLRPGSYGRIELDGNVAAAGSFTVALWLQPTRPDKAEQTVLRLGDGGENGFTLDLIDGRLRLGVRRGGVDAGTAVVGRPVANYTWYFASARYDHETGEIALALTPTSTTASELADHASSAAGTDRKSGPGTAPSVLHLAGAPTGDLSGRMGSLYNGKLEAPVLYDRALTDDELASLRDGARAESLPGLVGAWDFSLEIGTSQLRDRAGHGLDGRFVQRPTRAVTGHNWDGSQSDWTHAPEQYGAVHFHDDDLDDAGWDRSLQWTVPAGTPSGHYALHLEVAGGEDDIPFVVRPAPGTATASVLVLAPLFSYLAYANEHLMGSALTRAMLGPEVPEFPSGEQDRYIVANQLNSLYDSHSDGSGVCYSSWMRPLVNMRPKYATPILDEGHGSPHQFNADLHLVDWLHEQVQAFDVAADVDLYREGVALLSQYKVVITGSHHEYWSARMLDAMRAYLDGGGRLMYLAGNGFYWVTELEPESGHTVEVRRVGPATRGWDAAEGEAHLASTGELGGLWRYRNRAPQRLVGVGFTAQGVGAGRPYARQDDSFDPRAAFVFAGVGADELIGDFPCLISRYGAAGFELDRLDHSLGSPHRTMLLATATGFSDSFQHVSEETLMTSSLEGGTVNELVRADMVLLEYPNGGAVFTPGSIAWCGSLSYNDYQNNVSRITRNVLERFVADDPVF